MAIREPERIGIDMNGQMVEALVQGGYIRTPAIEAAFRAVPRHRFLPQTQLNDVYSGRAIPTRFGPDGVLSSSSEPLIMAWMLEQLDVQPGHQVFEIGTGTGYNAALLGRLVGRDGFVTTMDIDADIAADAVSHLGSVGAAQVAVTTDDGWKGMPEREPFDRIESTVGVWDLSPAWVDQLRPGGLIVVPLWLRSGLQASIAFEKRENHLESVSVQPCGFMRLRGLGAGPEVYSQMGEWTVCLDDADAEVLAELLRQQPVAQPVPRLTPGRLTSIALVHPNAVTIFSITDGLPRFRTGILDMETRSLALVEGQGLLSLGIAGAWVNSYGGGGARDSLDEWIGHTRPVQINQLRITAVPSLQEVKGVKNPLATLVRPNFSFLIEAIG